MILNIRNLRKDYNDFHLDWTMELKEGMITGIIGANGAGKSTLFKSILGLINIDGGLIELFGKDYKKITLRDKEEIGVVLSEGGFSSYLTIGKIVPIMKTLYHKFDEKDFLGKCECFQLPLDKQIKDMSTGMKAKLNVLIAMSHEARLLILDEPTAGLDVIARSALLDMMREYMEVGNRSILISSHISSDLESLCDDLYMIHKGREILHEDTDTLRDTFGILKMTPEQYEKVDHQRLFFVKKEIYGYHCITRDKDFFINNYPQIVLEKGNVDDVLMIIERGDQA